MIPVHEPDIGASELAAVAQCLRDGHVGGNASPVAGFEHAFASALGVEHAVAVSSGTAALHLAWLALGIGPGDEVAVPSFSFAPCADMVAATGARPVFVDSDDRDFTMSVEHLAAAVTPRTRAVLAVHMYGHACDLDGIVDVCRRNRLALVEDCAQAIGTGHRRGYAGTVGDVGCYSFYANKVLTTGEGGMVVTRDRALAKRVRRLSSNALLDDASRPYVHDEPGFNYRMSAVAAALGTAQLARLDEFLDHRAANAARYRSRLTGARGVVLPVVREHCTNHPFWGFPVLLDPETTVGRDEVAGALRTAGVETRAFYYPLHLHPAYPPSPPLPACERFAARGLLLPGGNTLRADDVDRVCDALLDICG